MTITHDILLSSGRTVKHTPQPNGSQFGTPTPGPREMTPAEWIEYCDRVRTEQPRPSLKTSAALRAQDFQGAEPTTADYMRAQREAGDF